MAFLGKNGAKVEMMAYLHPPRMHMEERESPRRPIAKSRPQRSTSLGGGGGGGREGWGGEVRGGEWSAEVLTQSCIRNQL